MPSPLLTEQTIKIVSADGFFTYFDPQARAAFCERVGPQPPHLAFGLLCPAQAAGHAVAAAETVEAAGEFGIGLQLRGAAKLLLGLPGNVYVDIDF